MIPDWSYNAWPSGHPYDWSPATRGDHPDDQADYHVDLGAGTVPKGRIGVDRYPAPGIAVVMDLDSQKIWATADEPGKDAVQLPFKGREQRYVQSFGLPFGDNQIESIITHHCLEHIGDGFIALMDECWRVLAPGGPMRIIVPAFPSMSAVADPDHKRYFMEQTFLTFGGKPHEEHWMESFSVPYTKARFTQTAYDETPLFEPEERWTGVDSRELRVTLRCEK